MDEYCDAIQYEGLVFAAITRATVFAWNPYDFGKFIFHYNYNCFIHMHAGYLVSLLIVFPRSCEHSTTYT